jgi:type II secretory pathway component PulF
MIKIVPVHVRMFQAFDIQLPEITQWLLYCWDAADPFRSFIASQFQVEIPLLPTLLIIALLIPAMLGALYYIDLLPAGAPIVSRLRRRIDASLVMRTLALAVNQRWPMTQTIWMLSRLYPSSSVRGRLRSAGHRINNGEDWCLSLHKAGLLRAPEVAVLHSATRVGNLEWALDEMSDSSVRRLLYRLRLAVNFLFPTTLFLFGLVVAFVVISLFVPLVDLIQGMVL